MSCWTVSKAGAPKLGFGAAIAVRNKLYSFGGYDDENLYNQKEQMEVHVFNAVSLCWNKLSPVEPGRGGERQPGQGPLKRAGHTAVLIEGMVYIWGGYSSKEYEDYASWGWYRGWYKH